MNIVTKPFYHFTQKWCFMSLYEYTNLLFQLRKGGVRWLNHKTFFINNNWISYCCIYVKMKFCWIFWCISLVIFYFWLHPFCQISLTQNYCYNHDVILLLCTWHVLHIITFIYNIWWIWIDKKLLIRQIN